MQHHHSKASQASAESAMAYQRLAWMSALSFAAMFALMYAMVDRFANVLVNINQAYMAGLMLAPMVGLEIWLMRHMYIRRDLNLAVLLAALAFAVLCWIGIRQQLVVTDSQFLRSMIPHHASAILMCERASLEDVRIRQLCTDIIRSQRGEIDQMRALLEQRGD